MVSITFKSVKLEMRGRRMTAISMRAAVSPFPRKSSLSLRLSSSSMSICRYGATPTTSMPDFSSKIAMPGSRMVLSPRNLLMIRPLTIFFSSFSSRLTVPISCANTPPRSISPTRSTGAFAIFAMPILTISSSFRFTSAGLPAPSITMISFSVLSSLKAFITSGTSLCLKSK